MAPIQRQRRRGLHRVHQVSLQQFRKSVLRQSTVTDNIGQSVPGTWCSSSKGAVIPSSVNSVRNMKELYGLANGIIC